VTSNDPAAGDPDPKQTGEGDPGTVEPAVHEETDEEARDKLGASSGLDKKRTIIGAIVAIVFLAIVFSRIIPQFGDYAGALETLKTLTWSDITTLVIVVIIYLFIYGWPFVAAAPGLKYPNGFIVNQSAFTVSNGIPGGGAFGLGLQYAQLTSYKIKPSPATSAIGATGVWSIFITLGLPTSGVAALALSGDDAGQYLIYALIGFAVLLVVIGLFALILRSEKGAEKIGALADRITNPILAKFGRGWHVDLQTAVLELRHDLVDLVRRRWIVITLAQIGVSWSQFAILYAALVAVTGHNGTVPLLAAYGAWAISQIGIMIPITPGGLGTVDAALIALLTVVGVSAADATAAALLWRAASYVPQMIIGLICIFYWRWQESRRRQREAQEPQPA
jgi:uncharacterized membrane protein YbhN (UPF0104 family)